MLNESEFINSIDCDFPYNDRVKAIELIDQANLTSANAAFAVLDELCRQGYGVQVERATLLELIDIWNERNDHPLAEFLVPVAVMMVKRTRWSVDNGLGLLEKIAPFPGLYAALSIVAESVDDTDGVLKLRDEEIRSEWASQ